MSKYNIVDRAKFVFYQIPKLLIHGETYRNQLTSNDILAYAILIDRLNVSIKNNWYDENGNIYFVYSNKELCNILNVTRPTVNTIKKNLTKVGLLEEERTGRANRLYLLEPIPTMEEANYLIHLDTERVEDKSIYTEQDKETLQNNLKSPTRDSKKFTIVAEKPLNQDSEKNGSPTMVNFLPSDRKKFTPSKKNLISSKDSKDNKESKKDDQTDTELISKAFQSKKEHQETERQVITDYIQEQELEFLYGTQLIQKMVTFSFHDFDTFLTFINKLKFSHQSVEKQYNLSIPIHEGTKYFEYTQQCLLSTFHRAIQQSRFGKVNNIANYLFISFKQVFIDVAEGMIADKQKEKEGSHLFEIDVHSFNNNEN